MMRSSWFKWVLIVAALLISSGGNAHAITDHAPCAVHQHHHDGDHHHAAGRRDCGCSCFACLSDLVMPAEPDAPHPVAYSLHLAPERASPLASRVPSPELDPPRPSALS